MIDLFALAAAIVLIILVVMLRSITTMPFARLTARFLPSAEPPGGTAPLFDQAFGALAALGFSAPRWVLVSRVDGEPATLPLRAVLTHPEGGAVWLAPPAGPAGAQRLFCYYVDRLEDGRSAISQPFDAFYEATQTEEIVARTASERDFAAQWAAHRAWVASLGRPVRPLDEAQVLEHTTGLVERQRQSLIRRGRLHAVNEHLALPTLRFAAHILKVHRRTPKAPPGTSAVPAELVAMLARQQEHVSHRAPTRRTQWILFLTSVALFMVVGAVMWGPLFALGILVVVLIHESGHFLAMRAFGYRNVHMLALPLVGGVAMGVNANPSATRAAWMSLMGPLPGIVIGWLLLIAGFAGAVPESVSAPVFSLALLFLFVNYLNVLPVPPLDGAHVVQGLLPPRFARLQTLFLASAAAIGAFIAWQFGFVLLTLIAGLQLLGVPSLWKLHGAERDLAADATLREAHPNVRRLRVARKLERELGPAINATQRVKQTNEVLHRLDTRPMGALARLATGAVYLALLVVPVSLLVLYPLSGLVGDETKFEAQAEAQRQARDAWSEQARALPLSRLLAELSSDAPLPAPASAASIAAGEARLHSPFPPELREFYALHDGAPDIDVLPAADVAPADATLETLSEFLDTLLIEYRVGEETRYAEIPLDGARTWWRLGGDEEAPLFYLPAPDPRLPGKRVVSYFLESPSAYGSLREWLEASWIGERESEVALAEHAERMAQAYARLKEAPVEELLAGFENDDLLVSLLVDLPEWPEGASPEHLAGHAKRLERDLPADYAEFLQLHDGFPPLKLLPIAELVPWAAHAGQLKPEVRTALFEDRPGFERALHAGRPLAGFSEDAAQHCYVAAGSAPKPEGLFWPALLWCPDAAADARWIDLGQRQRFATFHDWLLERVVPLFASREMP